MALKLNPPEHMNFRTEAHNMAERWRSWKETMLLYLDLAMKDRSEKDKCQAVLYIIGEEGRAIFRTWTFPEAEQNKVAPLLKKFEEYCIPKTNITLERYKFNTRRQQDGEGIDAYVTELRKISKSCSFGELEDELIRDRVVVGIQSERLKERMLRETQLTLEKAVSICQAEEASKTGLQLIDHQTTTTVDLDVLKKNKERHTSRPTTEPKGRTNYQTNKNTKECTKCGYQHPPRKCPAYGKKCGKCGKMNHFMAVCQSKSKPRVHDVDLDAHSDDDLESEIETLMVDSVIDDKAEPGWMTTIIINRTPVKFKIDTGADISVMSKLTYDKLKKPPRLEKSKIRVSSPGGKLKILGCFVAKIVFKKQPYAFKVFVVEQQLNSCLLSRAVVAKLGLVTRIQNVQINTKAFGTVGKVKTTPVKIELKQDAKPYNVLSPRRVPFPLQKKVKEELDKMEKHGIIEKTREPTEWCAPMVPVRKKNGQVRICVDYKKLNSNIKRPNHMIPNLEDIAPKLSGSRYFSTLDASGGFFQIPLSDSSSYLTTFITPYGRYRYTRVPMGISLGPEVFQAKMEEILGDLDGCEPLSDDTIVYGRTEEEHDKRLKDALNRIEQSGLKLNKDKCSIKKKEVKYFGHIISEKGIRPDEDRVEAILKLKEPRNVTELKTVLGMLNYLSKFVPQMSNILQPMSALLKKDRSFLWGPEQQKAFDTVKDKITSATSMAFYDVNRPTIVSADASSYGLGGALLQHDGEKYVPIAFASRTMTESETRYAQIEKECLAAVWSCEKFSRYLVGLPSFTLETDHKPLVPIMMTKDLDKTPLRCQRLLMRMMQFNPTVVHKPGKELIIADALSRFPLETVQEEPTVEAVESYIECFEEDIAITGDRLNKIRSATVHDSTLQQVISYTLNGWPTKIPEGLSKYKQASVSLSVKDGLLIMDQRIVIPESQREVILSKLHQSHQGINKCRKLAQETVWWPGLSSELKTLITNCKTCKETSPEQRKEPLKPSELPSRPWKKLGMDLLEFKKRTYLVVVDYYSRWLEVIFLNNSTSNTVINKLKILFATQGLPDELRSDNGPQFTSKEFKHFLKEMNITHVTSSPNFPQSNGLAESAVKIAKTILQQQDWTTALMIYRATPHSSTNVSPAEALMNRKIRTQVPILDSQLGMNKKLHKKILFADNRSKAKAKQQFDRHHGVTSLPTLSPGHNVLLKDDKTDKWTTQGTVVGADTPNRTYLVNTPSGVLRRNRKHLQVNEPVQPTSSPSNAPNQQEQPENIVVPPPNSEIIDSPPRSPVVIRPATRSCSGYVANKPVRYKEEE